MAPLADVEVAQHVLHRTASYLPDLKRFHKGSERINVFRLAKLCRLAQANQAYLWMAGTQTPGGVSLSHILNEVLSVAEYERSELQKAKEKLGRCTCQS